MRQITKKFAPKALLTGLLFLCFNIISRAQDNSKVQIDTNEVSSWMSRNWIWLVGAAIVLILIIALSGSNKSRTTRTTTVRKNDIGDVTSTTTTTTYE